MQKAKSEMPTGPKVPKVSIIGSGAPSESSAAILPLDGLRHNDNESGSFATDTDFGSKPTKGGSPTKSKKNLNEYSSVVVADMIME